MKSTILGFPRIGKKRELKFTIEKYWKGLIDQVELKKIAAHLRREHIIYQKEKGVDFIPSNDFSFYDQMLDMCCTVGAIPKRYNFTGDEVDIDTYFKMARGDKNVTAMEMTKWFDTNYHYIVPEFEKDQTFSLLSKKVLNEYKEAKKLMIESRPVLIGPITFLLLGKNKYSGESTLVHLEKLLPVYKQLISDLEKEGVQWIQFDEPILGMDLTREVKDVLVQTYQELTKRKKQSRFFLTSYFEDFCGSEDILPQLEVDAIHFDLHAGSENIELLKKLNFGDKIISLGVVDGRNIWKTNFKEVIAKVEELSKKFKKDKLWISSSCSLLHCPYDLNVEVNLDHEIKNWLSFSVQKLEEITTITKYFNEGAQSVDDLLKVNREAMNLRKKSSKVTNKKVQDRVFGITNKMFSRKSVYEERKLVQRKALNLPLFPTTTIGSLPQTKEVRSARSSYKRGALSEQDYNSFLKKQTLAAIKKQEEIGLDILVHGEFERNDMVEYFGELIDGFAFTKNGWVQSYGSRCVKPPIIFGDLCRPKAMTVEWSSYAQSLTDKPVKGMLTGPVTMLKWSFVRDDIPYSETCKQMALVLRDEVLDLENAGIKIIQIDEPALKEAMPLKKSKWEEYFKWSIDCFKLSATSVKDETQIHTHMCYSEFNDIIDSIAALDADVISIETSRSQMELLDAFKKFKYPNEIGPGVYDIHSPRVPSKEEISSLLFRAKEYLSPNQLWVNPDCGLKTRGWEEVVTSLEKMVHAAKELRSLSK